MAICVSWKLIDLGYLRLDSLEALFHLRTLYLGHVILFVSDLCLGWCIRARAIVEVALMKPIPVTMQHLYCLALALNRKIVGLHLCRLWLLNIELLNKVHLYGHSISIGPVIKVLDLFNLTVVEGR